MKKIIVLFLFVIVFVDVSARTITEESARMTAQRFVSVNTGKEDTLCLIGNNPFRHFYVFGGTVTQSFVIISADDRVIPVLGYSLNSKFDGFSDDMPSVKDWLKSYDDQIEYLIQHHVEPSPEILKKWQSVGDVAVSQVGPLMSTMWNQDGPFNAHCPIDVAKNQNCKTGCVATAMAQVMNYWEFPVHGEGTISYSWNGVTISENFGNTMFDWSNMKDDYRLTCTDAERDAVATLMKSVGVATKMKYGVSVSSTYTVSYGDITYACAENALKHIFHYSKNIYSAYYDNYSDSQWKQMMRDEVYAQRPVIYSGLSSYSTNVGHS
ncbi:MAG: C10 family peptidase, partial [Paludibacteraceae bacterium]|nr:C10 family peptidase [Paludibacteraceae bacterium]